MIVLCPVITDSGKLSYSEQRERRALKSRNLKDFSLCPQICAPTHRLFVIERSVTQRIINFVTPNKPRYVYMTKFGTGRSGLEIKPRQSSSCTSERY